MSEPYLWFGIQTFCSRYFHRLVWSAFILLAWRSRSVEFCPIYRYTCKYQSSPSNANNMASVVYFCPRDKVSGKKSLLENFRAKVLKGKMFPCARIFFWGPPRWGYMFPCSLEKKLEFLPCSPKINLDVPLNPLLLSSPVHRHSVACSLDPRIYSLIHWLLELFAKNAFFGHFGGFETGFWPN